MFVERKRGKMMIDLIIEVGSIVKHVEHADRLFMILKIRKKIDVDVYKLADVITGKRFNDSRSEMLELLNQNEIVTLFKRYDDGHSMSRGIVCCYDLSTWCQWPGYCSSRLGDLGWGAGCERCL